MNSQISGENEQNRLVESDGEERILRRVVFMPISTISLRKVALLSSQPPHNRKGEGPHQPQGGGEDDEHICLDDQFSLLFSRKMHNQAPSLHTTGRRGPHRQPQGAGEDDEQPCLHDRFSLFSKENSTIAPKSSNHMVAGSNSTSDRGPRGINSKGGRTRDLRHALFKACSCKSPVAGWLLLAP